MLKRTVTLLSVVCCSAVLTIGCGSETTSFSLLPDSETFKQSTDSINTKIDILWVIDNSRSMNPSQQKLASEFQAFIQDFETKGYDFQMAVTTTDAFLAEPQWQYFYDYIPGGGGTPYKDRYYYGLAQDTKSLFRSGVPGTSDSGYSIIDAATPNLVSVFQTNILQGIDGYGDERSFQSMRFALENPNNAGLMRQDAFFAVIFVTDEDDHSYDGAPYIDNNTDPALHDPQIYVDYLDNLTGSSGASRKYNVSNISFFDTSNPACASLLHSDSMEATRVQALTDLTDGIHADMCGDFQVELQNIASKIITLSNQFYLDRIPIPETISISVNGVSIPEASTSVDGEGWTYNAAANSIVFTAGSVPPQGAAISVNFDPKTLDFD